MRENLDSRVVAALRFRDATIRHVVMSPLLVSGDGARIVRNPSGMHVLTEVPGFGDYSASFDAPQAPAGRALKLSVRDPSRRYLPRTISVTLPRAIDPALADQDGSIWKPSEYLLYPSPAGNVGAGWALLRLSIKRQGTDQGLPFAYIRVTRDGGSERIGAGLADHRGEALVAVAGIPVTSWNTTTTTTSPIATTVAAKVTAYYDQTAYDERAGIYPDPDALENDFSNLPHSAEATFDLASGQSMARRIDVPVP
jgi:hypothetical protein